MALCNYVPIYVCLFTQIMKSIKMVQHLETINIINIIKIVFKIQNNVYC